MLVRKVQNFLSEYGLFAISIIVILLIWEFAVRHFNTPHYILPAPSKIFLRLATSHSILAYHAIVTLKEVLAGFVLGSLIALLLAIGMSYSKVLDRLFYPVIVLAQTFPKEALAPLFVVWLGFGILPKVVMAALISFFPMTVNTVRGLRSIDPLALDLMKSLSANQRQIFFKLRLPCALPYIFAAMKISVTLSVVGAIIGEFIGASKGLGHLIMVANSEAQVDLLFASLTILGALGVILFLIIERLEKFFLYWHESMIEVGVR